MNKVPGVKFNKVPEEVLGVTFRPDPRNPGEVAAVDDGTLTQTLASTRISAKEFREAVDRYLRGMVEVRLADCGVDAIIEKELGRRIEVAIKLHAAQLDGDVKRAISENIKRRLADLVAGMDLVVHVSGTGRGGAS